MMIVATARQSWFSPAPAMFWSRRRRHRHRLGGNYALAAARALIDTDMSAEEIARKAMKIAAEICVFTNEMLVVEISGPKHPAHCLSQSSRVEPT